MKKYGIGSRILTLLLVLAMVLSYVPFGALAVNVGDIAAGTDYVGDTGLKSDIDTGKTISWPVRIYDYLNDGMLFEYANAGDSGDISDNEGGAYGGGKPAPQFSGAQNIIGTDYTVNWGYSEKAYTQWLKTYSSFKYPALEVAVNFKSPSHLHLVPKGTYTNMEPWVISSYADDNSSTGYAKETVRYAVVVYRTNGLESGEAKLNLGWETNLTGSNRYSPYTSINYDYRGSVALVANSEQWNYVVVDMKAGTLGTNWDSITNVYRVLADFQMNEPTDSVDISHVAYFDTEFEAIEFGKDAVAFDNDPGEFLDSHPEYTEGTETPVAKPTTGNNGMDFSVSNKTTGGYAVDTYTNWTSSETGYYIGTMNNVGVNVVNDGERSYVQVNNKNRNKNANIKVWDYSGGGSFTHVTLVYKTTNFTASDSISFYVKNSGYKGGGANMYSGGISSVASGAKITLAKSEGEWTYVTYAFSQIEYGDSDYTAGTNYNTYGLYLPACMTGKDMSLDIAMVNMFNSASEATAYGKQGAAYMNGETTTISGSYQTTTKKWNTGNNVAFSMLYAGQGGGWSKVNGNNMGGGASTYPSGYYSYGIGKPAWTGTAATEFNSYRTYARDTLGYPVSDTIYLLNSWSLKEAGVTHYDMSQLDLGYTLINYLESGVMTAGLLESGLTTVTAGGKVYRVPNYKEDTVEYIANLLRSTLIIPKTDASGNYNYNYVQGTANGEQYGYADDGKTPLDLASALRKRLGITFTAGKNHGSYTAKMGDYSAMSAEHKAELIGAFGTCKDKITTFVDAAYYLLMNLYVDNSYNQAQSDYKYLVLSQATLTDGRTGYVFDGGFTTGDKDETANTDEYRQNSQSAVEYNKTTGTISQSTAASKDQVFYTGYNSTTRFPFLPVTDATGVYAGETKSPYVLDDGRGPMGVTEEGATFVNRNYNFAISCNGEFVYHAEDELYFEFEGDDDVYLFVNGVLVLDIGAAHSITDVYMNVNEYVAWAQKVLANPGNYSATDVARAEKLNLVEGGIYSFDFYYMERHGWGSNCRIVSNMRVTDPALRVDKTANQNGEDIPYGGVVIAEDPIAYSFKLTNTGNTKLYNLTFTDNSIGVALDYTNGLTVADGVNGVYVMDSVGGKLDASDLYAVVSGYEKVNTGGTHKKVDDVYVEATGSAATHRYSSITVNFADNQALKDFLVKLVGEGLGTGKENTELTQTGAGLWVDASITIKGIYYKMTAKQIENGVFDNTVDVTATTKTKLEEGELLQSKASHRVYVSGAPAYYQWAGHNVFITAEQVLKDASQEAGFSGNQLYEYLSFFQNVAKKATAAGTTELAQIDYRLCDKLGKVVTYDQVKISTDNTTSKTPGYLVNYGEAGTYSYYVLMSLKGTDISDLSVLEEGTYAIVRVTIFVADVEDSVFVLDYGLKTEYLDANGELFKNDMLFGNAQGNNAAFMGISLTDPSFRDVANVKSKDYNRIDFTAIDTSNGGTIFGNGEADGYFSVNLPAHKGITYNAYTKTYSLTEVGTTLVKAVVPQSWAESNVYLYYWYDNGASLDWPGEPMKAESGLTFSYDVPSDVSHVIISNGTLQTEDLTMTPGTETIFTVEVDENNKVTTTSTTVVKKVAAHVTVPNGWGDVYLEYLRGNGEVGTVQMTLDSDGYYSSKQVPGDITKVKVTNAEENPTKQSVEMYAYAGKETWITVQDSYKLGSGISFEGTSYNIHVNAPDAWETVYLYGWDANGDRVGTEWPGTQMTQKDADGNYVMSVPDEVANVIVNNGSTQTADLPMYAGRETWLTVAEDNAVSYAYNTEGTFTVNATVPENWSNVCIYYWNKDNTSQSVGWPGVAMNKVSGNQYSYQVPNWATHVIITETDGAAVNPQAKYQSADLQAAAGRTNNVIVSAEYNAYVSYSTSTYTIYASVPGGWGDVYLYYWGVVTPENAGFPGVKMTASSNGWYSLSGIPSDVSQVIIANSTGELQTVDLTVNPGMDTWITVTNQTVYADNKDKYLANVAYGTGAEDIGINFVPLDFMDSTYSLYMAVTVYDGGQNASDLGSIDVSKEVQMYKKVTVLPANVVYYEDDFPAITYNDTNTKVNKFTGVNGYNYMASGYMSSENMTQSVNQSDNYGYDSAYDGLADTTGSNTSFSANGLTKVTIRNTSDVATFTFKGTGFELIGRTKATYSASMLISVADSTGKVIKSIPVITEYNNDDSVDASNGTTGTEQIHQVPVIRLDGLTYGSYTVKIQGVPDIMYDDSRGFVKDDAGNYVLASEMILYIDGLRIFNPLGSDAATGNYNKVSLGGANEQGATFHQLRDMIVNGTAAVATYAQQSGTQTNVKIYSGNNSWTENHEGTDVSGTAWTSNQVSSVNAYLLYGPNNEVYMKQATTDNQAIVFYAKVTDAAKANLQVAVRGIDEGLFSKGQYSGVAGSIQVGTYTDGKFAWTDLVDVDTSVEMYYTINLAKCPTFVYEYTENGTTKTDTYYQVALKVDSGMISYSSLKYNGLELNAFKIGDSANGNNGTLVVGPYNGAIEEIETVSGAGLYFDSIAAQMSVDETDDASKDTVQPTITPRYPSLSFEDEIYYNVIFTATNVDDVMEWGLVTFESDVTDGTVNNADHIIPGVIHDSDTDVYKVRSNGIPAKKLGNTLYFRVYAKLTDGSYVYSDTYNYSAVEYARDRLANSANEDLKKLCVAMLNYSAAAQTYMNYNVDTLANASLTADQLDMVEAYRADMVASLTAVDSSKVGIFARNGFGTCYPSVNFEGTFSISYSFAPSYTPDNGMKLYYWDMETYTTADELTKENATGVVDMAGSGTALYKGTVEGITAKEIDETIFVAGVYEVDGTTYSTGILNYSLGAYCIDRVAKGSETMQALAAATAVYGYYAKIYFAN